MIPEEHQRIVNDIIRRQFPDKNVVTEDQRIIGKAVAATIRIRNEFAPIVAAHGFPDKKLHGLPIGKAFLEEFNQWPKDDLVYLCATIHMDSLLEKLR